MVPVSLRPLPNAVTYRTDISPPPPPTSATTGIAGCCARAAGGQTAADPAIALMKSRRRIAFPRGSRLRRHSLRELQQVLAHGGMGFQAHCARQQCRAADVRFVRRVQPIDATPSNLA